jgi:hypothetical protein
VAVTFDGDASTMYVNGAPASTVTGDCIGSNSGNHAYIGATSNGTAPTTSFDGKIDDVRVYSRALSPGEILEIYQLGAGQ